MQLTQNELLRIQALKVAEAPVSVTSAAPHNAPVFVEAPLRRRKQIHERRNPTTVPRVGVN